MLRLLARRARAQWPLLAALLAVVTIGATLLGTCALLVTRTAGRAIEVVAARAAPDDVKVTAYNVTVRGADAASVAADSRDVLTSALAPFPATTATRVSSVNRSLPSAPRVDGLPAETYLSGLDDLPARATLAAGRWPRAATGRAAALEAAVLEPTARLLGLAPGDRVRLGAELSVDPAPPLDVTVVGVARPLPGAGWDRDPLAGAGYDLHFEGQNPQPVHAYGPFLVDLADLFGSGSLVGRLEVTARPDLSRATRRDLDTVTGNISGADRRLAGALGDRVRIERVESPLPDTIGRAREQQRVTAAAVLALAVLGCLLTATALALAGRLTAGLRTGEHALLSALGVGPGQFAAAATVEGGALALLAAALAVPASSALHAGLTHLAPLSGAGLATGPGVGAAQVLAVAAGAFGLAAVLVVLAVRRAAPPADRRHRRDLLARSGADLLLVAFAAAGWWQLAAQPTGSGARADAVRVVAPALVLAAGAALALRVAPPALRAADRLARRARGLAFPLAATEAARRSHAMAAGLLVGLACAAGTFGIGLDATWDRSQRDQADLSVGTDLALTLAAAPRTGDGAAVGAATGGTVSPAADRGIAVGQWIGSAGDPPRLVAVDTARAGSLLRGRLDGDRGWAGVGAALAPPTPAGGLAVPAGAVLTISGTATGAAPVAVTPRLLMQDATGLRTACDGEPLPLDGTTHRLPDCAPVDGLRLVAVALPILPAGPVDPGSSAVAVTLTVPGTAPGPAPWTATSAPPAPERLVAPAAAATGTPAGAELRMTATASLGGPENAARTLVATAFPDPGPVPVAISGRFARELNVHKGAPLSVAIGTTPVALNVAEVLPSVPSAPGAAAILADLDTLSRALVAAGNLDFPMDAWWVGDPAYPDAAARATGLHLGTVTTRAEEAARLAGSPPRAGLPAALRLLVPAAALLLLAGVVLHVTFDLRARAVEVARLRGLGMYRREIRAVLLGQHAGVLLPLVVAGAAVGALATYAVAPLMVRSDTGAVPVPAVLPVWPWAAEAVLLALLLAGALLAVAAAVVAQARRADAAHLRVAS
ncbi:permease [Phytohabitans sp. ZYX-F-186]|uniref:Permease n=1 Tax=Phytohabitans maris TaxID=3071409 RepID=A0ABU0ZCK9_9ACTN|nr:FtsX-like permease family protein [Phytohabitans sp. ZYX-F-186]MDQ7904067.1 permease [Phytohabitans sp. ZYX-F-186]